MVNTFLCHQDPAKSARYLNDQRLGKQRIEAKAIINNLEHYDYLAEFFELEPYPHGTQQSFEFKSDWVNQVMAAYYEFGKFILVRDGYEYILDQKIRRPKTGEYFECTSDGVCVYKGVRNKTLIEQGDELDYLLPDDFYIGHGYKKHWANLLWLGFTDALKNYTNAHIQEWIRRGKKNTMELYEVPDDFEVPDWTKDESYHRIYRASLVNREIDRLEKVWYAMIPEFVEAWLKPPKDSQTFLEYIRSEVDFTVETKADLEKYRKLSQGGTKKNSWYSWQRLIDESSDSEDESDPLSEILNWGYDPNFDRALINRNTTELGLFLDSSFNDLDYLDQWIDFLDDYYGITVSIAQETNDLIQDHLVEIEPEVLVYDSYQDLFSAANCYLFIIDEQEPNELLENFEFPKKTDLLIDYF